MGLKAITSPNYRQWNWSYLMVSCDSFPSKCEELNSQESVGPKMLSRGLISNSNSVDEEGDGIVWVETDGPLLFMCSKS